MFKKKMTLEEAGKEARKSMKKDVRAWIKEYPILYYTFKEHMRENKGDFTSAYGDLYEDYKLLKDPVKYMADQERRRQIEARAAAQKTRQELDEYNAKSRQNAVQCPYCKSWQTEKIGTGERVVSIAVVGPASGKIGKQWHCLKCGSNF